MKKVLIPGPDFYGYNQSIARAFRYHGYDTCVLDYGVSYSLPQRVRYPTAKSRLALSEQYTVDLNALIRKTYDQFHPDIVFVVKGDRVDEDTLAHMEQTPRVLWLMDRVERCPYTEERIGLYDWRFFYDREDVSVMAARKLWASFLPLAVDEQIYYPVPHDKDIDLLFVGALYPNRLELLNQLVAMMPHVSIQVYGRYISAIRHPLRYLTRKNKRIFTNHNISPEAVNLLYNRSRLCLNIHHPQQQYGANQRFFEILGARAVQVVDQNPFASEVFGTEVIMYRDMADLKDAILHSLGDFPLDKAEAGYQKVLSGHRFKDRIARVLEYVRV